jgi:DNA (cytosine-5)-methyltransferase 1
MTVSGLKFASAYSGAGGLDYGFSLAGMEPIWASEANPDAAATYEANLGHPVEVGDIAKIRLPRAGAADIVIGGPPCQGFSVAGRMDPTDPRSTHVLFFLDKFVRSVQPKAFVMENVKALALNRRWAGIREQLWALAAELGFETKLFVLNAADFGVPQARERMFLVGVRGVEPQPPTPTTSDSSPTVGDALRSLPAVGASGNATSCSARVTLARKPVLRRSPYAGMLFNGQGRPLRLDAPAQTLPASMGGNRTPIVDQLELEEGAKPWVVEYHQRLWGGGRPLRRAPARLRRLTVEEAAALQTFPSDWEFCGSQSAQYRQIGNAVPPQLAYHVALSVARLVHQAEAPGLAPLLAIAA